MARQYASVSTTALMRGAGERAGWNVAEAIAILRAWSRTHPNAASAAAVIAKRAKGAPRFAIEASGFVVGVAG